MTEEEIKTRLAAIADGLRAKGYTGAHGYCQIGHEERCFAHLSWKHDDKNESVGGFGNDAGEALQTLEQECSDAPDTGDLMRQRAVEALEAARLACSKIDADDVAASLAALVTRLSEDLLEHKEGAA